MGHLLLKWDPPANACRTVQYLSIPIGANACRTTDRATMKPEEECAGSIGERLPYCLIHEANRVLLANTCRTDRATRPGEECARRFDRRTLAVPPSLIGERLPYQLSHEARTRMCGGSTAARRAPNRTQPKKNHTEGSHGSSLQNNNCVYTTVSLHSNPYLCVQH